MRIGCCAAGLLGFRHRRRDWDAEGGLHARPDSRALIWRRWIELAVPARLFDVRVRRVWFTARNWTPGCGARGMSDGA